MNTDLTLKDDVKLFSSSPLKEIITLQINEVHDLPDLKYNVNAGIFVELENNNMKEITSRHFGNNKDAKWNNSFEFDITNNTIIKLKIMAKVSLQTMCVAECEFNAKFLLDLNIDSNIWLLLKNNITNVLNVP